MDVMHQHAPLTVDVTEATNWNWEKFDGEEPPSKTYKSLGPR